MRFSAQAFAILTIAQGRASALCFGSFIRGQRRIELTHNLSEGIRCRTTAQRHTPLPRSIARYTPKHRSPAQTFPARPAGSTRLLDVPLVGGREQRRRCLEDAIARARAFRQWCVSQSQKQHSQPAPLARHGMVLKAAAVATLADVATAQEEAPRIPTFPLSSSSPVTLPGTERRLLTQYACLLHAVRQAATQVAADDYHVLYASAVASVLVPAPAALPGERGATPFPIPRSTVWQSGGAADASTGEVEAALVVEAAQRLASWTRQWHDEILQRHSAVKSSAAFVSMRSAELEEGEEEAAEEEEDHAKNNRRNGDVASLAPMLLRGEWRAALRHLASVPGANGAKSQPINELFCRAALHHRRRVMLRPSGATSFPRLPRQRAMAATTPVELQLLHSPPSEGLRVDQQPMSSHDDSENDGEKPTAKEALRGATPPSCIVRLRRRLWALQHLPGSVPPSLVHFEEARRVRAGHTHNGGQVRYSAAMPHAYLYRGDTLEKVPWYPLCVLGQVLACVMAGIDDGKDTETAKTVLLRRARKDLRTALFLYQPVDYASLLDYVHLLFVSLGSTMTAQQVATSVRRRDGKKRDGGRIQHAAAAAERAFADTAIALFRPPSPAAYAAPAEPADAKHVSTESLLDQTCGTDTRRSATLSPGVEEQKGGSSNDVAAKRLSNERTWAKEKSTACSEAAVPWRGADSEITATHKISADVFGRLCAAVQSWHNYHTSLYCETLSQVCDGTGIALGEVSRVLHRTSEIGFGRRRDGDDSNDVLKARKDAIVVLAPESAVAVSTAVLLQRLAQQPDASPAALADECPDVLFFAVPHDKAHAVASYFKGLYDPSFFKRVCVVGSGAEEPSMVLSPAAWETNAAARLVGRSLRRVDRYPTRTTEAFFARHVRGDDRHVESASLYNHLHHDGDARLHAGRRMTLQQPQQQAEAASFAPPLAMDIYSVDLRAAVARWGVHRNTARSASVAPTAKDEAHVECREDARCGRGTGSTSAADAVVVVAAPPQLPYGLHAVYKPAHVNCTLHAHYPSLVSPLLSQDLPWRGGGDATNTTTSEERISRGVVPALRQQGLVNRIDVGTSGVVLVARDAASLQCATDAMVRRHQVRKTYRALVQRWPPLSASVNPGAPLAQGREGRGVRTAAQRSQRAAREATEAPLFSTAPFLSSLPSAVVCVPVYAAGASAAAVPQAAPLSQEGQRYNRQHAALQDRRPAITRYRVLEWFAMSGVAYVEVNLDSGRRHQVRQHFAQLGFPLVGDARYHAGVVEGASGTCFGLQRAALHAYSVELFVPGDAGEEPGTVVVQASLPADMLDALHTLRKAEKDAQNYVA